MCFVFPLEAFSQDCLFGIESGVMLGGGEGFFNPRLTASQHVIFHIFSHNMSLCLKRTLTCSDLQWIIQNVSLGHRGGAEKRPLVSLAAIADEHRVPCVQRCRNWPRPPSFNTGCLRKKWRSPELWRDWEKFEAGVSWRELLVLGKRPREHSSFESSGIARKRTALHLKGITFLRDFHTARQAARLDPHPA